MDKQIKPILEKILEELKEKTGFYNVRLVFCGESGKMGIIFKVIDDATICYYTRVFKYIDDPIILRGLIAHELGHIACKDHLSHRIASRPILLVLAMTAAFFIVKHLLSLIGFEHVLINIILGLIIPPIIGSVIIHSNEYCADLYAAKTIGYENLLEAYRRFAQRSGNGMKLIDILYPTIDDRITFLKEKFMKNLETYRSA